mgnify:CR=1 FL=1
MANDEKLGRPLKFQDPAEMQAKIDAYFVKCDVEEIPYTITGLAYALDTWRSVLCDYEERPELQSLMQLAKLRVENFAEKRLYTGQPTGPIFALKNFGWSDTQNVNMGGQKDNPLNAEVTVKFVGDD